MKKENSNAVVVFTFKSLEHITKDGGSWWWRLNPGRARRCTYVVCTRNSKNPKVEGREAHGSAFLVGKISDVTPYIRDKHGDEDRHGRYIIKFNEFAQVSIPDVWKGHHNPVSYGTLEEMGIDPSALKWQSILQSDAKASLSSLREPTSAAMTIAEAKKGLAIAYGVKPDAIEIVIRG